MGYKKGESGNPAGRPKGAVGKCVKVKDDFFKAYFKLGGLKNLLTLFDDKRVCITCGKDFALDSPLVECDLCNGRIRFQSGKVVEREFLMRVLPQLMPKRVDLDANLDMEATTELSEEDREIIREIKERLANPTRSERRET